MSERKCFNASGTFASISFCLHNREIETKGITSELLFSQFEKKNDISLIISGLIHKDGI